MTEQIKEIFKLFQKYQQAPDFSNALLAWLPLIEAVRNLGDLSEIDISKDPEMGQLLLIKEVVNSPETTILYSMEASKEIFEEEKKKMPDEMRIYTSEYYGFNGKNRKTAEEIALKHKKDLKSVRSTIDSASFFLAELVRQERKRRRDERAEAAAALKEEEAAENNMGTAQEDRKAWKKNARRPHER